MKNNKNGDSYVPPTRVGKVFISAAYDVAVRKQLKQLALDKDTSIQQLMTEALNDLFTKYDLPPIAD